MIINSNQIVPTRLGIISDGTLFLYNSKTILFQQSNELIKFHTVSLSLLKIGHMYANGWRVSEVPLTGILASAVHSPVGRSDASLSTYGC